MLGSGRRRSPHQKKALRFDEGWSTIEKHGINKLLDIMHRDMRGKIGHQEFSTIYTTVYNMCLQKPKSYADELYQKFEETVRKHLSQNARPQIFEKERHGEFMVSFLSLSLPSSLLPTPLFYNTAHRTRSSIPPL